MFLEYRITTRIRGGRTLRSNHGSVFLKPSFVLTLLSVWSFSSMHKSETCYIWQLPAQINLKYLSLMEIASVTVVQVCSINSVWPDTCYRMVCLGGKRCRTNHRAMCTNKTVWIVWRVWRHAVPCQFFHRDGQRYLYGFCHACCTDVTRSHSLTGTEFNLHNSNRRINSAVYTAYGTASSAFRGDTFCSYFASMIALLLLHPVTIC